MKKPNDMDTLLTLPLNPDHAMILFGDIVGHAEKLSLDISGGSLLGMVMFNFGLQVRDQGFLKLTDTEYSRTSKSGQATFELPCWGVMEVAHAILALEPVVSKTAHFTHVALWNPFVQKANRIIEHGENEESAGGDSFLSMN
jgi:hypothetical protein|tara:strand:+ start:1244 stop:1669 length:426 start_codon:yes stop_codon:yes gene_type:complete